MHPVALLRYLLLPLRGVPLLLIVIFGLLLTLAEQAGMFGIPMLFIIGSWFFKYGFALLDSVIDGYQDPPVLSAEMANPVEQRPIGLLLLLAVFYGATELLRSRLGDTAVAALRWLLLTLVPAMVAAMSITGRFVEALNPVAVLGAIIRIPIAYATLLVVIGSLWFIAFHVLQAAAQPLAGQLSLESFLPGTLFSITGIRGLLIVMLGLMLLMYLWLAMFACIGGTMYELRKELAIDVAVSPERVAARADADVERQRDKTMERVFAELRGGAFASAGETVRRLIAAAPQPLDECRWLYARAAAMPDPRLANYLAQLALPRLLAARSTGEALRMTRERLVVDSAFRPLTGGELLQLAQLARDAGDRAMARRLLSDFDGHYPNDPMSSRAIQLQTELQR